MTLVFRFGGVKLKERFLQDSPEIDRYNKLFENVFKAGYVTRLPGMEGVVAGNSQHTHDVDGTGDQDITRNIRAGLS